MQQTTVKKEEMPEDFTYLTSLLHSLNIFFFQRGIIVYKLKMQADGEPELSKGNKNKTTIILRPLIKY